MAGLPFATVSRMTTMTMLKLPRASSALTRQPYYAMTIAQELL